MNYALPIAADSQGSFTYGRTEKYENVSYIMRPVL